MLFPGLSLGGTCGQLGPMAGSHCPLVVTGEHSVAGAEPAASLGLRALGLRALGENRRARSTQIFPYPDGTVYASGRQVSKETRLHSVWVHL